MILGRAQTEMGPRPLTQPAHSRLRGSVSLALLACLAGAGFAAEDTAPAPALPGTEAGLSAARAAIAAGRLTEAQNQLDRLLLQSPDDARIRMAMADLAALRDGSRTQAATPTPVVVEWALAEIRQGLVRADAMARADRPADAAELLEVVRRNLIARELDAANEIATALVHVDAALVRYHRETLEAAASTSATTRAQALAAARDRADGAIVSAAASRTERLDRVRTLQRKQLFEQALAECRVLVDHDPEDHETLALYRELLTAAHQQRKLSTEEAAIELRQEINERISRSLIPTGFEGDPIYPDGWTARHTDSSQLTGAIAEPEWRSALRDSLRRRVSLDIDGQNALDVLRTLATDNRLNLVIEPALAAGAAHDITVHAPNLTLEHALTWICQLADTRWTLVDGAVWIGNPPNEPATLAVYDVATLVHHGIDQPGKKMQLGGTGGDAAGGLALFATNEKDQTKPPTPEEVSDLLKSSVTPSVWTQPENSITIRGNTLFVTAPADTHRLLREFIRGQEQTQNLMVRVDARWLTLDDNFAEEIGVDWTVDGTLLAFPGTANGLTQQNPNSTFSGSAKTPLPATTHQSNSGISTQGLKLSYGLLGPLQLSAVLTAAENNLRGRVLYSPSVTTLNGIRSNVFVGSQTAYISDYEISAGKMDPKIAVVATGASLDIKPFVSADRKYVTLDLQPAISSITLFTDFITAVYTADIGRETGNGGVLQDPLRPVLIQYAQTYPIELPNLAIKEAATTLTIPDHGSVLIGGFGKSADETSESRVPFLGNIPYLGRLFGHRGRYSDHEKLYLMATITIISYDEQEAKL